MSGFAKDDWGNELAGFVQTYVRQATPEERPTRFQLNTLDSNATWQLVRSYPAPEPTGETERQLPLDINADARQDSIAAVGDTEFALVALNGERQLGRIKFFLPPGKAKSSLPTNAPGTKTGWQQLSKAFDHVVSTNLKLVERVLEADAATQRSAASEVTELREMLLKGMHRERKAALQEGKLELKKLRFEEERSVREDERAKRMLMEAKGLEILGKIAPHLLEKFLKFLESDAPALSASSEEKPAEQTPEAAE